MSRLVDITGEVFSRLTVIALNGFGYRADRPGNRGRAYWLCKCACGNYVVVSGTNLKSSHTESCGCSTIEHPNHKTHGMSQTPEYRSYSHAKGRCENITDHSYKNYGGRGIEFLFDSFEDFYAELGPRPVGMSLNRIDNDGNYEVGNVEWADDYTQSRNRRGVLK